jgi:hypothetical protein
LRDAFVAAGKTTGELVWPLPIDEEYKEAILSEVATVKNIGPREGSACASASFVKTLGRGHSVRPSRHRRHRLDDQAARPISKGARPASACASRWRR